MDDFDFDYIDYNDFVCFLWFFGFGFFVLIY